MSINFNKSQSFTIEFILAFLLFCSAVILSIKMVSNIYYSPDFDDLMKESELLSDNLMSEGYPENWTASDVIKIGLLDEDRLSSEKLALLYDSGYYSAKNALDIKKDFFIYFKKNTTALNMFFIINASNATEDSCGYGHPDVVQSFNGSGCMISFDDAEHKNLVKISRLTVFNSSLITMVVNVWDK